MRSAALSRLPGQSDDVVNPPGATPATLGAPGGAAKRIEVAHAGTRSDRGNQPLQHFCIFQSDDVFELIPGWDIKLNAQHLLPVLSNGLWIRHDEPCDINDNSGSPSAAQSVQLPLNRAVYLADGDSRFWLYCVILERHRMMAVARICR